MGNLCGKESTDNFAQPGRTVASAPPPRATASVPKDTTPKPKPSPKVGGPPRTLGGENSASTPDSIDDARRKAAEAAEARARSAQKTTGKLGAKLQEQKKQTRTDTLNAISQDERRLRDADAAAESRAHN